VISKSVAALSIHQNYRLNGVNRYTIFNLPISVTNSISRFLGAGQLQTKPIPGPLSASGGRMSCDGIANPMVDFNTLVTSVNNPPGQLMQDIGIQTSPRSDGGQAGAPGQASGGGGNENSGNASGSNGSGNGMGNANRGHTNGNNDNGNSNANGNSGSGNGNNGSGNTNGNGASGNRNGNGNRRPNDGTGVIGTGNISGQKEPQPVLGGAEEVLTACLWAVIMVTTTAVLFTTIIW
jgi:hypothetical protein